MTTPPALTLTGIEKQYRRWFTGLFPIPMDIRTECVEA